MTILILRVADVAELVISQNGYVAGLLKFLIDVKDMGRGVLVGDEPELTSVSLHTIDIIKGLLRPEQEGFLVSYDFALDGNVDLLIDARDVETNLSDEPFFSSVALLTLVVLGLSKRAHLECLVGLNGYGSDEVDDLDLHLG